MFICNGRFCVVEELTTGNDRVLFNLMLTNANEYRFFVSDEEVPESFEVFQTKLQFWFSHGRISQFLVRNKHDDYVGTIFFYGHNSFSNSIKCSCFFIPSARGQLCVMESLGMVLNFARLQLKATEIIFSVYMENLAMLRLATKLGAEQQALETSAVNPQRRTIEFVLDEHVLNRIERKLQQLRGYLAQVHNQ